MALHAASSSDVTHTITSFRTADTDLNRMAGRVSAVGMDVYLGAEGDAVARDLRSLAIEYAESAGSLERMLNELQGFDITSYLRDLRADIDGYASGAMNGVNNAAGKIGDWFQTHTDGVQDPLNAVGTAVDPDHHMELLNALKTPGDKALLGLKSSAKLTADKGLVALLLLAGIKIPKDLGVVGSQKYVITATLTEATTYEIAFDKALLAGTSYEKSLEKDFQTRHGTVGGEVSLGGLANVVSSDTVVYEFGTPQEAAEAMNLLAQVSLADGIGDLVGGFDPRNPVAPVSGIGLVDVHQFIRRHMRPTSLVTNSFGALVDGRLMPDPQELEPLNDAFIRSENHAALGASVNGSVAAKFKRLGISLDGEAGVELARQTIKDDELSYGVTGTIDLSASPSVTPLKWRGLEAGISQNPGLFSASRDLQVSWDLEPTPTTTGLLRWVDLPSEAQIGDRQPDRIEAVFETERYALPLPFVESRNDVVVESVKVTIENPTAAEIQALGLYFLTPGDNRAMENVLPRLPSDATLTFTTTDLNRSGNAYSLNGKFENKFATPSVVISPEAGTDLIRSTTEEIVTVGELNDPSTIFLPIIAIDDPPADDVIIFPLSEDKPTIEEVPIADPAQVVVEPVQGLNMRTTPTWDAPRVGVLRHGSIAELTGETMTAPDGEEWVQVVGYDAHGGGQAEGWVAMEHTKPFSASGVTMPDASRESPQLNEIQIEQYVVEPGDTLVDIAQAFDVTPDELIALNSELQNFSVADANHVHEADWIFPGDVVYVPGQAVPVAPATPLTVGDLIDLDAAAPPLTVGDLIDLDAPTRPPKP